MTRRSVLVVEDDPDLRAMFRTALALSGFDVRVASDGLEALHRVDSNPPDLIVLDIVMPRLDGIAVAKEIAAQAHTRNIPIVVVTGSAVQLDFVNVKCVLRKPVGGAELVRAVEACLASGAPPLA